MDREELLKIAKPILFNTEMVKAILDRRKTQTRRIVKTFQLGEEKMSIVYLEFEDRPCLKVAYPDGNYRLEKVSLAKGDILYVRETFTKGKKETLHPEKYWYIRNDLGDDLHYKADCDEWFTDQDSICKWKPLIHMPKAYTRIFLKVTDVRVERLQDIHEYDCIDEGINTDTERFEIMSNQQIEGYPNNLIKNSPEITLFKELWNSTSKDGYKWEDNPYVFVYEFERITS
ncbi:MAG: hypothetical protein E3J23_05185 [Candidatus Stahlbacteria bacterium]|nr:MAG: hypothetical protein E3J23_05185 [Candidatus Stahlbacteria bacterium]